MKAYSYRVLEGRSVKSGERTGLYGIMRENGQLGPVLSTPPPGATHEAVRMALMKAIAEDVDERIKRGEIG